MLCFVSHSHVSAVCENSKKQMRVRVLVTVSYHGHCREVLCKCENCPKRGGRPSVTLDRKELHGKYARVRLECVAYGDHRASLR